MELKDQLKELAQLLDILAGRIRDIAASLNDETSQGDVETLSRSWRILGLDNRARTVFRKMELKTLRDVVDLTPEDFLDEKRFGHTSLNKLRRSLAELGLRLRDDDEVHYSNPTQNPTQDA